MKTKEKKTTIKTRRNKLITHNGSFHADDIFAAAALAICLEKKSETFEIIRTRDEKIIAEGKENMYVFDVGGVYDPDKNKFDHHQPGGAGKHTNGIEYASFGLVWKKFGKELCGSDDAVAIIDDRLVSPIDANDNAFDLVEKKYEISPYTIQDAFRVMRPIWREDNLDPDKMFLECVEIAKKILSREIIYAEDAVLSSKSIAAIYKSTENKKILVFDKNYASADILTSLPEVLFVVYPRASDGFWGVKAVRNDSKNFENRKNFPTAWAGLTYEKLAEVSGVTDAVFCHKGIFMSVAKSKEGAIKLAQIAVES